MKIAYVTPHDIHSIHAWSGLVFGIANSLKNAGCEMEYIDKLKEPGFYFNRVKRLLYKLILKQSFQCDRIPYVLESYARQVEHRLAASDSDVVLCHGTAPIARLNTKKPIVFWTDATFAGMIDFYPHWTNLCKETLRDGMQMEQEALSKCCLAIYSSQWAAQTAMDHYQVDPAKVHVVPYGANIECDRSAEDIRQIAEEKSFDECHLLLLGVDWDRKGGDTALAVAGLLNQRGLKTTLHVVGCTPPAHAPDYVKAYGFVSKTTPEGRALMDRLLSQSHFLILPSKAECVAVVFAEASSYGLPSVATNVGGIPTAVADGINGMTFSKDSDPGEWCDYLLQQMASKSGYVRLAETSFQRYSEMLNWEVGSKKVVSLIQAALPGVR